MATAEKIGDVMTRDPQVCDETTTLVAAASMMRDHDIGDVLVESDGSVCGVVTDRDIVVRAVAEGADPVKMTLGDVCSRQVTSLSPDDSVTDAVQIMREKAIRRLPVMEDGHAVGIVSIGDLALRRDRDSALAGISAAPANT